MFVRMMLIYIILYNPLVVWIYNQNTGDENNQHPWCRHILSILLDLGRRIGTETCKLVNSFKRILPLYVITF